MKTTHRIPWFGAIFTAIQFAAILAWSDTHAGSATWKPNPQNSNWNTAGNWSPSTVPNGPADTATFALSNNSGVSVNALIEVDGIVFNSGASAFAISASSPATGFAQLTLSGAGVTNNSGVTQNFFTTGGASSLPAIGFTNSATAGTQVAFQNGGAIATGQAGGVTLFSDTATAGAATFRNNGGAAADALGGLTQFTGSATAAFASITNEGGTGNGEETGSLTEFLDSASAGNATIINQPSGTIHDLIFPGAGNTIFHDSSTAGSATVITNAGDPFTTFSGTTQFFDTSTAEHATFNDSGEITFYDNSTAANGAFTLTPGALRGVVSFYETSTAADAVFTLLDGAVAFNENSSAGNATVTRAEPSEVGSLIIFRDSATADHANLAANGNTDSGQGERDSVEFDDASTAANATITLNPGAGSDSTGALGFFNNDASAGDSVITINGAAAPGDAAAALLEFSFHATAGNATLIANGGVNGGLGGTILFSRDGQGGNARIELFGNGRLELGADRHALSLTIGSLEGDGEVFLEGQQLQIGNNDLSTTFSGTIQDRQDTPAARGSVVKIGRGTLTLSGVNSYTGGTTINSGTLLVSNMSGSATGGGTVQVTNGTLGGGGIVAGAVTIGTGSGSGAALSPGAGARTLVALRLLQQLTFKTDGTYVLRVRTKTGQNDTTTANGITIESGAVFSLLELGHRALSSGTVVTAMSNSSGLPISGTFSNLADGSTITVGSNTYLANYEGGDGNDLTLAVVP